MARKPWPLLLLDLPAYALGVFILYWSVPLSALLSYIKFWKLNGKRDDAYGWGKGLQKLFGIRILQLPGPTLCQDSKIVYLANHRSWADFFLDVVLTHGRAQMLSRMAVLTVFPAFMIPVAIVKGVILFQRGKKIDIQEFNRRVSRKMDESPLEGLIVYPEGHRNTRAESLSLKRGMLHYCYDHKLTVQIIMTRNKEAVLSEKDFSCHFGQTVLCGYTQPIKPADFDTFQKFVDELQRVWDSEWRRVYSSSYTDGSPMEEGSYERHAYSTSIKRQMLLACSASSLAFLLTLVLSWRVFFKLTSLLGFLEAPFLSIFALWIGLSLARALRTLDLPDKARAPKER